MTTRMGRLLSRLSAPLAVCAGAEGGAAAVYVAITLPAFVGAGGLAVDVASWYSTKRTMQSGADAAAYAAALELARQGLDQAPDLNAMRAAADDAAGRNGIVTAVTLNNPPLSGPAAGDPQSVEVIANQAAPVYFTGLFLGGAPNITSRAVAKAVVSDACVWSLHPSAPSALNVAGTADVDLDCGVVVNSDDPQALDQEGSSCLSSTSISVTGDYSGSCVSPEPEVSMPTYGDPLSYMAAEAPAYGACDYPNQVVVDSAMAAAYGGGPVPLNPGVYCDGIEIQANQEAIFAPGMYILDSGEFRIAGNAHVSNTTNADGGVTFYLTGSGTDYAYLTFESGANITLTPRTVDPLANVLFYQDPAAPASTACKKKDPANCHRVAGGVTMDLTGMLYFPSQHVEFTGGSTTDEADIVLVASTVTFTGNSYLNADYAGSLLPQQYYVRLVE